VRVNPRDDLPPGIYHVGDWVGEVLARVFLGRLGDPRERARIAAALNPEKTAGRAPTGSPNLLQLSLFGEKVRRAGAATPPPAKVPRMSSAGDEGRHHESTR
jgi:hypothetical protein